MNEIIFFLQILVLMGAVLGALMLGAEALVSLVCLSGVLANICVLKQTTLFGLEVTASDAYMVAGILSLNVLQEYFGRSKAQRAIVVSFCALILYVIISQIHLLFVPSVNDLAQVHFAALFSPMPRIMIASVLVYGLVTQLDYFLYGFLKKTFDDEFLVLRNIFSLAVTQLIDTVLFSFLGLYGLVASIGHVILFSFTIKVLVILLCSPFIGLCRYLLRSK